MLPGNVDPRRPDKVQRYKAPPANANGQGEDLTPDYMNILGQRATTVSNAEAAPPVEKQAVESGGVPAANVAPSVEPHLPSAEEAPPNTIEDTNSNSNGATANVIPTSPQYGVAILPNSAAPAPVSAPAPNQVDLPTETVTISTDSVIDTTAKPTPTADDPNKDLHSTPSRNDRFKVVKIASLEPFKRGRWKCMDYVDEAPPMTQQTSKATQSAGSINVPSSTVYLQTQSLPQQQIQQMLMQGGFTNGQFFPNVHQQMVPQAQYFYQQGNVQTQTLPQQLVGATTAGTSMPAQFINAAGAQPYFAGAVVQNSAGFAIPANYQNVHYVPANILQNQQGSAFVPTSQQAVQMTANFQQSQTYAGQPTQPMVNGHAYPTPNEQVTTSLPTQTAKSVILNSTAQPVVTQAQISQPNIQNQIPVVNSQSQSVPIIQQSQQQPYQNNFQQVVPPNAQVFDQNQTGTKVQVFEQSQQQTVPVPSADKQANNVYTNPQFDMNVNSLTVLENAENAENPENSGEATSENPDDPSKTNPVVNAIDNKIEQAMDLVKSHLMYTVREEVEVLKEKIAELMERIQQLETENNFLRSQIPKSQTPGGAATPVLTVTTTSTTTTTTTNESTQQ